MFLALGIRSRLLSQQLLAPSPVLAAFQRSSGIAFARNFTFSALARAASDGESKTVFVKSLSWNVDEEWLRQDFGPFGKIVGTRIMTDPQGRSKGFGFIDFEDAASAKKAVAEMHEKEIDGRIIYADIAAPRRNAERERETSPPSTTLFLGNIAQNATEDSIYEAFDQYDGINTVRIPKDFDTGSTKGIAFVEFTNVENAQKAFEGLRYNLEIDGRKLRLDYSQPKREGERGGFGGDRGDRRGGFDGGDRRGGRGGFGGGDRGDRRGGKSYGLGGYGGER